VKDVDKVDEMERGIRWVNQIRYTDLLEHVDEMVQVDQGSRGA
jgi:hypothetical protein